jgi:hypothetical protein
MWRLEVPYDGQYVRSDLIGLVDLMANLRVILVRPYLDIEFQVLVAEQCKATASCGICRPIDRRIKLGCPIDKGVAKGFNPAAGRHVRANNCDSVGK